MALLEKIVVQLAQIGSRITFCGMGTPLLHPQFTEIMNFCRSLPGLNFGLTIQAPALDEAGRELLHQARPGFIEISLPTFDPDLFAQIYPGCELEQSLDNIARLTEVQPYLRGISIIAVRTAAEPKSNEEITAFWAERKLHCRITTCHSRGGNASFQTLARPVSRSSCGLFAAHAFITWQGMLLSCCHDLGGDTCIADLSCCTISEAGRRKLEILQQGLPYAICQNCDEPAAGRALPETSFPEKPAARRKFLRAIQT